VNDLDDDNDGILDSVEGGVGNIEFGGDIFDVNFDAFFGESDARVNMCGTNYFMRDYS
jgi:hypothetical protein